MAEIQLEPTVGAYSPEDTVLFKQVFGVGHDTPEAQEKIYNLMSTYRKSEDVMDHLEQPTILPIIEQFVSKFGYRIEPETESISQS